MLEGFRNASLPAHQCGRLGAVAAPPCGVWQVGVLISDRDSVTFFTCGPGMPLNSPKLGLEGPHRAGRRAALVAERRLSWGMRGQRDVRVTTLAGAKKRPPGWDACWGRSLCSLLPAVGTWRKALGLSDLVFGQVTHSGWGVGWPGVSAGPSLDRPIPTTETRIRGINPQQAGPSAAEGTGVSPHKQNKTITEIPDTLTHP